MAIKTWDKLGITATWVPYDGGGEAIAVLLYPVILVLAVLSFSIPIIRLKIGKKQGK